MPLPIRGSTRLRLLAGFAFAAILAVVPTTSAVAATATHADASRAASTTQTQPSVVHPMDAQLGIDMQTQEQDEWCWVASGDTIATYLGHGTDQNSFCDMSQGMDTSQQCPNQPGELSMDQTAFSALGVSAGTDANGSVPWSTVTADIDANHPEETGIAWTAGGGHAEVIYGYDSASQSIYFGDPWPDDQRMNEMAYDQYVSNDTFAWQDTLYGVGA